MMLAVEPTSDTKGVRLTLQILEDIVDAKASQNLGFRLWDGTLWPDACQREATVVLNHPGALRSMFLPLSEVGLAEAYLRDDFDVEGNMESVFQSAHILTNLARDLTSRVRILVELRGLPLGERNIATARGSARLSGRRHSLARDAEAIRYHYDVSTDFYRLWLDSNMVYSCGYFESEDNTLDRAQLDKLDYICRKLRLLPGQRLLDIGCGWGGLVIHAVRDYGVEAIGITLSKPQAELANLRIQDAGLTGRARVLVRDYRHMQEAGHFDALASVGMFEHVGTSLLPRYFRQAARLLKPGGVFLNHGTCLGTKEYRGIGPSFSARYVFPDGELVPVQASLQTAYEAGLEVRDLESLREHYAITLRHWVSRLENMHDRALEFVDEATYRVWRLFMSGGAFAFASGMLSVFQVLYVKPETSGKSNLPLTRNEWYRNLPAPESARAYRRGTR